MSRYLAAFMLLTIPVILGAENRYPSQVPTQIAHLSAGTLPNTDDGECLIALAWNNSSTADCGIASTRFVNGRSSGPIVITEFCCLSHNPSPALAAGESFTLTPRLSLDGDVTASQLTLNGTNWGAGNDVACSTVPFVAATDGTQAIQVRFDVVSAGDGFTLAALGCTVLGY